jgi:hypothetical protein
MCYSGFDLRKRLAVLLFNDPKNRALVRITHRQCHDLGKAVSSYWKVSGFARIEIDSAKAASDAGLLDPAAKRDARLQKSVARSPPKTCIPEMGA